MVFTFLESFWGIIDIGMIYSGNMFAASINWWYCYYDL